MKRVLIFLAVVIAVSIFPLAAYAKDHHGPAWRENHERQWRENAHRWEAHDREWKAHRYDRHWREVHAKKWHRWYQWHREYANEFHLRISGDSFALEIDD